MKFIAKPDTWFKAGTECELVADCRSSLGGDDWGVFRGIRVCQNPDAENRDLGEHYIDEESCSFDEFEAAGD